VERQSFAVDLTCSEAVGGGAGRTLSSVIEHRQSFAGIGLAQSDCNKEKMDDLVWYPGTAPGVGERPRDDGWTDCSECFRTGYHPSGKVYLSLFVEQDCSPTRKGETPSGSREKCPVTETASAPLAASVLEALARYDTPTICNAMEIIAPKRRLIGYTTKPLVCPFPDLPPIVGYARTVTIRSVVKSGLSAEQQSKLRIEYYEYVGTGQGPRISVIQDLDGPDIGFGAFWGEVQSAVHKALGCLGVITDGSIRDIPQWAPGFQALAGSIGPSHAWVHAESFGQEVCVAGMTVRSDDLIHADSHGAVIIPHDLAAKLPEAAELCGRRETPILEIARSKDFSLERLKAALKQSAEIH
jgi:regulator of RNase E activity RraA